MEVKGKISAVMPVQQGTSKSGNAWTSQEFLLDYYWWSNQAEPTKMKLKIFGEDKVRNANLMVGEEVTVRYHIMANQVNGRWFNDVQCDGVTKASQQNQPAATQQQQPAQPTPPSADGIPQPGRTEVIGSQEIPFFP